MFKEGMLHPLLQQIFKVASLCMNTSQKTLSPFISHVIQQLSTACQTRSHLDIAAVVLSN